MRCLSHQRPAHQCIEVVLDTHHLANLPWWVCGQSMGGGLALRMAHRAWRMRQGVPDSQRGFGTDMAPVYETFSGCFAICPLVKGPPTPPAPAMFVMRRIASLLWLKCMPSFLDPPMDITWIWKVGV